RLVVEVVHRQLHGAVSPAAAAAVPAPRSAAGNGRPAGGLRLAASLTRTQPPLAPGTFLFLKVLPGDCRCPVEPRLRCEIDTPWLARRPPKLCRFMPPA